MVVPAGANQRTLLVKTLKAIQTEVDESFILYKLESTKVDEGDSYTSFDSLPSTATALVPYFGKGYYLVPDTKEGRLYLNMRIGFDSDVVDFIPNAKTMANNTSGGGIYKKVLQCPRSKNAGWLLYSDRNMNPEVWQKIFKEGMMKERKKEEPTYQGPPIDIGLRTNKNIWDGVTKGERGPEYVATTAVHVEFREEEVDIGKRLLRAYLQNPEIGQYSNYEMTLVDPFNKTGLIGDKQTFQQSKITQQIYLNSITSISSEDISAMDTPLKKIKGVSTLRSIIMNMEKNPGIPLFVRVDLHYQNPGTYVFTYPSKYGPVATDKVHGLGAYLKHKYGPRVMKFFTGIARKRFDEMEWDTENNRPISAYEKQLTAVIDNSHNIPWLNRDSVVAAKPPESLEELAQDRPQRGQDTDGDSIYHRNQSGQLDGDSIADDSTIGSITTVGTAVTTNSTRVRLANVTHAVQNLDLDVGKRFGIKDPETCAEMMAFLKEQIDGAVVGRTIDTSAMEEEDGTEEPETIDMTDELMDTDDDEESDIISIHEVIDDEDTQLMEDNRDESEAEEQEDDELHADDQEEDEQDPEEKEAEEENQEADG